MPTGQSEPIYMYPSLINVPTDHLFISVSIQSDGSPEGAAALEPTLQALIDLLQTWEGRIADVIGQLYGMTLATVTPTDPDPLPE